ncbi:hypothetical protein [Geodermatophilus amargosae]|uniref:hypothetical protein n=1 Tax=Geodermatophilus amargosae TaxID=1296565 RepID=UPI0034E02D98
MTWAVTMDVAEPVELYDAVHRALLERTGGVVDGLLVHLARQTADGFQVVEVWESREDFERYSADVVGPVATEVLQGRPRTPTVVTPFDVRGLVLPRAGVAV